MAALKILFITYYWPPSGGAGVQRGLKFVKHLTGLGAEVAVLTVDPQKGSFPVFDNSLLKDIPASVRVYTTTTTEPFEAYRKLTQKKEIPYSGFANETKTSTLQKCLRFIRGNFFIPDARVGWNKHALKTARKILKQEQFDAVFTTSPPHSTQLIGLALKKEFPNVKWIADLRDPWTDIFYNKELGQTFLAKRLDAYYEKKTLEQADLVVVTSPDTRSLFLSKGFQLLPDKIEVITNGYDADDFILPSTPPTNEFCITYAGTLTETYAPEVFFKTLNKFKTHHPEIPVKLRLVGKASHVVVSELHGCGIHSITELVPYVTHDEAIKYLLSSTILFLIFAETNQLQANIPGKLFEYLAARKPIVAIGTEGSAAQHIIEDCKAGKFFNYKAEAEIYNYLVQLSEQWKTNPNVDLDSTFYTRYERKALARQLYNLISETVYKRPNLVAKSN